MLQGPFGLGGRNNWQGNGLLKETEEQKLKCALWKWKVPLSAVGMFSLVSTGLTLLPARRKGKGRSSKRSMVWNYFCYRSIKVMDWSLTGTTTPNRRESGNKSNEGVIPHPSDLQNWSLIIRFSKASYPSLDFEWGWVLRFGWEYCQYILSPANGYLPDFKKHSLPLYLCIAVSTPFIRPCATSKQKA